MDILQQRQRQQAQWNSARLALIRAIENGSATARDRFDNKMIVGSLVVWSPPIGPVWELVAVDVPPAGSVQPGTIQLTLTCQIPALMMANIPNQGFVLVGHQSAPGHAALTSPSAGDGPAAEEASAAQPPISTGITLTDEPPAERASGRVVTGAFGPDDGGDDGGSGSGAAN